MSVTPFQQPVVAVVQRQTISSLLEKKTRIDGRKLDEYRELQVIPGCIPRAEGSALVKLGNTTVLVGVKVEVGTPFPDTPDQGVLMVNAEFVPLASPTFEPGPPDENAIELARVIDRSLRELGVVDLSKLVIKPGEKVWCVWVDIYVLNHDGNLYDASSIAVMAALLSTRMPKYRISDKGQVELLEGKSEDPLPVPRRVVTVNIARLGDKYFVDPTLEEETVADTRVVIAVSDDGRIAGLQKSGLGTIPYSDVEYVLDLAIKKGLELHQKIDKVLRDQSMPSGEEAKEN